MIKTTYKLLILAIIVLFAQCSKLGYIDRRYTKGHYKAKHNDISAVKKSNKEEKTMKLPEVEAKTELSVKEKAPVENIQKEEVTASTKKESGFESLSHQDKKSRAKVFASKYEEKGLKAISKLPFSASLIEKATKSSSNNDVGVVTMILSIVGFAAGLGGFLLTFGGIIDTIATSIAVESAFISPLFLVAIVLGILALGCGIAAMIIGKRDLPGWQRTFSILAIVFGAVALVISGVWSMIFYSFGA